MFGTRTEHEKEEDRKREAVRDQHRFRSFARERDGNDVKWCVAARPLSDSELLLIWSAQVHRRPRLLLCAVDDPRRRQGVHLHCRLVADPRALPSPPLRQIPRVAFGPSACSQGRARRQDLHHGLQGGDPDHDHELPLDQALPRGLPRQHFLRASPRSPVIASILRFFGIC